MAANHNMSESQFRAEMNRWAMKHIPAIGKKVHKVVTEEVHRGIVTKTPVLTGKARGNWNPTTGTPSEEKTEHVFGGSLTGEPRTGEEKAKIRAVTDKLEALPLGETTAYVTNNQDYIQKLEEGRSAKSPPNAMVRSTIEITLDSIRVDIVPKGV